MSEADIEELAFRFSFQELSAGEKEFVLLRLGSQERYDVLRRLLLGTRSVLGSGTSDPEPHPSILRDLHRSMKGRRSVGYGAGIGSILKIRIPLYQSAIAVAAMACALLLIDRSAPTSTPSPTTKTIYVHNVDTVVSNIDTEKIVGRVVDSIKSEMRRELASRTIPVLYRGQRGRIDSTPHRRKEESGTAKRSSEPSSANAQRYVGLANLPQIEAQKRGRNLAEDSALSKFTVSANHERF